MKRLILGSILSLSIFSSVTAGGDPFSMGPPLADELNDTDPFSMGPPLGSKNDSRDGSKGKNENPHSDSNPNRNL